MFTILRHPDTRSRILAYSTKKMDGILDFLEELALPKLYELKNLKISKEGYKQYIELYS